MRKTLLGSLTSLLIPFAAYGANISYGAYQRRQSTYIGTHQPLPLADGQRHSFAERTFDASAAELDISAGAVATELVIIDAAVPDKHILYRAAKSGVDIVEITSTESGLAQLTGVLSRYRNLSALHIVSHALHGELLLGNSRITAENIKHEIEAFAALNGALRDGGDLLLYGCDLAAGDAGTELLEIIHGNTHLDVAASTDKTGARDLTGDWELEINTGNIETELPFSDKALKDFSAILAAANGTYDFSGFTDGGATLTSTDFIVSAKDSTGTPDVPVSIYGSAAFLDSGMVSVSNYFYVTADGVNTGSFELTGLAAAEYYTGEINLTNVRIVGILRDNSQITSAELDGSLATGAEDFIFGAGQLSNFVGVQLKAFKLYFDVTTRTPAGGGGGPFVGDASLFDFSSFTIANAQNPAASDGNLTASAGVTEPVGLDTTVDTVGEAVDVFDFTIADGGAGDTYNLTVSELFINVSGTSTDAERSQVTWRLHGPDHPTPVEGTYNAGTDTITFSGLNINVANGGNETYFVDAYYDGPPLGVIEDHTFILSVDGDTNLTVGALGTQMGSTTAVTNGTGSTIDVVATQLSFTTDPAGSISGSALTTQPVVTAQDDAFNTDVDFTETITLSEASAGTLTNNTQAATAGVATFTNLTYTAMADGESFTLTANDQDGVGTDLPTENADPVTSDVEATKLVFTTQPAPTSVNSGDATSFTTVPVVSAMDANNTVDTGYATEITLAEVNGAGGATMTATGDTDGNGATVSITPSSGVATFTGMEITYTASGGSSETFNLRALSGGLNTADSDQFTGVVNDPPTIANLNGDSVNFTEGGSATLLDSGSNATIADGDSANFDGGNVTASITANRVDGEDVLSIRNQGAGPGQIGVSGANVSYGGVLIGTFTGGSGSSDLVITLTANGTPTAVQALVRNLTYSNSNTGDPGTSTRTVSITANDGDGGTSTAADVSVSVTGVNDAPTATNLTQTVPYTEDPGGSVALGDIVITDADGSSDTVTGTLTLSNPAAGVLTTGTFGSATSTYNAGTGVWTVSGSVTDANAALAAVAFTPAANWDQDATVATRVRDAADTGPADGTITLDVTPVNDAPTDIALTSSSINQSSTGTGVTVGTLSSVDNDGADTHTYALVANGASDNGSCGATGADGNANFQVDNDELETSGSVAAGSHSVCIETDDGTATFQEAFTITVTDDVAPTISSVSVPANGTYTTGQNLDFTVNTTENVTVDTGSGIPRIELTVGATTRYASYISGGSASELVFRYTVQAGDSDGDGIVVAASLNANGGTLRDGASNDLNVTLNSVGSTASVLVDTVAPIVSSVSVPADGTYITGQNLDFTVNTDEDVTVDTGSGTPQISLTIGASTRQATYVSGNGTSAVVFRYTVQAGDSDTDGIAVAASINANGGTLEDSGGNNLDTTLNAVGSTASVLVDAVAPTVSSVSVPANGTYIAGQNLDFTVNTNENVTVDTGGGTPRIALTIGATTRYADFLSGNGTSALVFRHTIEAGDIDIDGIAVATAIDANSGTLRDDAGNDLNTTLNSVGATTSVLVDGQAPTLSSSTPADNASGVAFDTDIALDFSENVSAGVGSVSVYDAADDSLVESFAAGTLSIVADVVTIDLTSNLTPTHNYYVQIDNDAFEDAAGNAYAGIADETTLNFTVGNNAPVAGDDSDTTDEDTPVAVDVLANDTDNDSALNAASTAVVTTPANGSTSVNTATGVITYTPNDDFNGSDSFTYTVEDVHGTISNTATVSITVTAINDAPVAGNDLESTPEDTNATFDVAANDIDVDTGDSVDAATITIVTPPTNGSATVNAGQVDYDPDADFNGTDTFTYTIEDQNGALSNTSTVTINVTGVNDLPTAANDSASVDEDDSVDIDVLDNDSDIDGTLDSTTVTVMANPVNGSTSVDALTGVITYTPSTNYNGSDSFTYVVQDDAGGTSNAATVNITVNSINDAPTAVNDTAIMLEDTAHEVNVLGDDSDIDGTLVPGSVEVVTAPADGSTSINTTTGAITYTPDDDFSGSDAFTYRVQDNDGAWSSAATVTMTVDNVNDPPVANDDSATLDEDASVDINIVANDTDIDDTLDATSVVVTTAPTNGSADVNPDGSVTYTPAANFSGIDSFTYEVDDAVGDTSNTATVSITIDPVNDAPVINGTPATTVAQDSAYIFTPSSNDVENDALTFSITNLPTWASFDTASGVISGTPGNDNVGTSGSIVISASDGIDSTDLAAFTITVTNVNDAPTISGTPATLVLQDMPYSFTPTADDVDASDTLTFSIANLPAWASFDTATGALTGLPNNSAVGFTGGIVISVSDGTVTTALPAFDITVMNVNDAPLTGEDSYNLSEDGLLQVDAIEGVLANDVDIDGDTLTATLVDAPASASAFTLNTDGSFSYQHDGTESRSDSFSYEVSDGTVTTEPVMVSLAIAAVNDAPEFVTTPETTTVVRGSDFLYDVGINDPDSVVQLTLLAAPEWLTLNNSTLSGTAPDDAASPASIQLRASDGEFTVDQSFDLTLVDPEDSVVTLATTWHKLPARVDDPLRLDITLAQTNGPALSDAILRVRLRGESSGATMEGCTVTAADLFECPTSLTVESTDEFRLNLTPDEEGNLTVELRLLDSDGNTVVEGITDVTVSEKPVSQGNLIEVLAHATALASIELVDDDNRELVVGTSLGDTVKLLDYDLATLSAEEIGEIDNDGETESVRVADVNLDSLPDILVINSEGDATQLYYNMGGLVFEEDLADSELPYAGEAVFIDLNGDDYPELVLGANGFNIYVYENNNGYFDEEPYVMHLPIAVRHFAVFNRPAGADPYTGKLAVSGSHSVRLFNFDLLDTSVGNNKPSLQSVAPETLLRKTTQLSQLDIPDVTSIQLADLDGDNSEEILLSSDHSDNSADDSGMKIVSVSSSDVMTQVAAFGNAGARKVSLADFNGDGVHDLLVANNNFTYQFYLGAGSLTGWTLKDTVIYQASSLVLVEDVNSDELSDVLVYNDGEGEMEFYTSAANGEIGVATDLQLTSSAAALGESDYRFNYVLTVGNQGSNEAQAVETTVTLPDNITVSSLPDNCSQDESEITCALQTVNAGGTASVTLVLLGDTSINSQSLTGRVTSDALEQNSADNRQTQSLSGMFEGTKIRVSGGSGSFGPIGLILLGLLALMRNRRLRRSLLPVFVCFLFVPSGQAQTSGDLLQNGYLELDFGNVSGDWNGSLFNSRLSNVTSDGEVSTIDDQRNGWQLLYGYRFNDTFSLEGGYLDWGDTDLQIEAFTYDLDGIRQLLNNHYPASGDGAYIGSRVSYKNARAMELYLKGGFWLWQSDYTIRIGEYREKVENNGIDLLLGAGFAVPVYQGLSLGGQVQRVSLDGESQTWLGLSVQFDFK